MWSELTAVYHALQSAITELETTNEELQSSNEELETINEELQSTNEELQTLNDELRERTIEISQVNGVLTGILEGVDLAVAVVDVMSRVQLWNAAAERLTGLREPQVRGRPLWELDLGPPHDDLRAALHSVASSGESTVVEADVVNRSGGPVRRRVTATPLRADAGRPLGVVVALTEMTG